jgi:predicted lipoprotein with Yx(FWY)xxD motif
MKSSSTLPFAALALLAASAFSYAEAPQTQGGVLTDPAGMTLYVFDKDAAGSGKSACNGDCAKNWPPLAATAADQASGGFTVITRDDGSMQWAYQGKPLYRWSKDQKPGDTTGDGFKNMWRVGRP